MVKSALARAGVALGNEKPVEKIAETPRRSTADLLSPAASKLAELAPANLPEPEPEPLPEDLPSFVTEVRIEAGQEPVAFGSLLETPEAEDDAAFLPPKPQTNLGEEHKWDSDEPEEEEEEEEEEWRRVAARRRYRQSFRGNGSFEGCTRLARRRVPWQFASKATPFASLGSGCRRAGVCRSVRITGGRGFDFGRSEARRGAGVFG